MQLPNNDIRRLVRLAVLISVGLVLFVLDSLLPKPIPFMRYGIANIAIVYIMVLFGMREAWLAAGIKVLVGSLLTGTFLSIPFWLSLGATCVGVGAMCGMVFLYRTGVSLVGVSVVGAVAHSITQLFLVNMLFLPQGDILALFPMLIPVAVVSGSLIGGIVARLLRVVHHPIIQ